jgi:hypothetical protein
VIDIPGVELFRLRAKVVQVPRKGVKHFHNRDISSEVGSDFGRPTISNDILLVGRNAWRSLFEEYWPEIGWSFESLRRRKSSTIEDVREALAILRDRPLSIVAMSFWSGSPVASDGPNLRSNRKKLSRLQTKIQEMERTFDVLAASHREAKIAVDQATAENKNAIQSELDRREISQREFTEDLARAENDRRDLDIRVRNEEAYWYSSELLDFLHSPRSALNPLSLANALVGLPIMKWRQSCDRASSLPDEWVVRLPYLVVCAISLICKRWDGEFQPAPTKFFGDQLAKLPRNHREARECFSHNWHDLRLAIEECRKSDHPRPFIPYAISSAFMRNLHREKSFSERLLDSRETFSPS